MKFLSPGERHVESLVDGDWADLISKSKQTVGCEKQASQLRHKFEFSAEKCLWRLENDVSDKMLGWKFVKCSQHHKRSFILLPRLPSLAGQDLIF